MLADLNAVAGASESKAGKRIAASTGKVVAKARTRDSTQALDKLTQVVDGVRQIVSDPPLIVPINELLAEQQSDALLESLHRIVRSYGRRLQTDRRHLLDEFELVQVARKVVGVGSVGTRAWILLLLGPDTLFLQAKEAEASVLEEFVGKSEYANHGERVVAGQHLMQAASDIFLGWERAVGIDGVTRDFYLRQLRDWKGSFEVEGSIPPGLIKYAGVCARAPGPTLAPATGLPSPATLDPDPPRPGHR